MGENNLLLTYCGTERDYEPLSILRVSVPKQVYTAKEKEDLYESVKKQVGKNYLPVLVPEDVKLEIISEI